MVQRTTKDILAESFLELAGTKAISRISIVEIVNNCGKTKPTFYRYFKDKYDLISWIYIRQASRNVEKIGSDGYHWPEVILAGLKYCEENREYMVNALKHTSGRDSFIDRINQIDIGIIMNIIRAKTGTQMPEGIEELVKIYCYGTGYYMCEWLLDNQRASCEEVAAYMIESLPEKLKPYLLE